MRACTRLVVELKATVGRPRKTWQNTLSADMRVLKVDPGTSITERNVGLYDGILCTQQRLNTARRSRRMLPWQRSNKSRYQIDMVSVVITDELGFCIKKILFPHQTENTHFENKLQVIGAALCPTVKKQTWVEYQVDNAAEAYCSLSAMSHFTTRNHHCE